MKGRDSGLHYHPRPVLAAVATVHQIAPSEDSDNTRLMLLAVDAGNRFWRKSELAQQS